MPTRVRPIPAPTAKQRAYYDRLANQIALYAPRAKREPARTLHELDNDTYTVQLDHLRFTLRARIRTTRDWQPRTAGDILYTLMNARHYGQQSIALTHARATILHLLTRTKQNHDD